MRVSAPLLAKSHTARSGCLEVGKGTPESPDPYLLCHTEDLRGPLTVPHPTPPYLPSTVRPGNAAEPEDFTRHSWRKKARELPQAESLKVQHFTQQSQNTYCTQGTTPHIGDTVPSKTG